MNITIRGAVVILVLASSLAHAEIAGEKAYYTGRYAEARPLLEQASKDPKALRARLLLGQLYRATGQRELEKAVWNRFYDDFDAGTIDKKSARELMYVALAARYLGGWADANDTFRDAVDSDPKGKDGARANIEWAALFLEKYDAGHAEQCLQEALKILPDDADAHALYARVKLEQGYDVAGAEREIDAALRKNSKHAGALAVRAEILVDNEEYSTALKILKTILDGNPEDLRARTVQAAAFLLREDKKAYEAEKARVIKTNPRASQFFHGVAEFLVKAHRYVEANALEEDAIKADPKDYVALAALGSNLLRLGDDANGLAALQKAWEGDRYNVRTYNLLNLFEDVIPKFYVLADGKPFRFRVARSERALVEKYIVPLVKREYDEMVKRYGFTPEGPLTIELYTDPKHYAVRTVGLPGLDALGVTFGKVITGMSPAGGRFNWGMMIWHEVAHVFALQMSKARVPRWFTEGLSEYETQRLDPAWTRRTHAELYKALEENRLPKVAELNAAFMRSRDIAQMVVAYHAAAETVQFLIRRFGFEKVPIMLRQFAAGKTVNEVLPSVLGASLDQIDREFRADLHAREAAYAGTFYVRPSDFSDVETLKERAKKGDHEAEGFYALALVKARAGEEAQKLIDGAIAKGEAVLGPKPSRLILLAAAELALARKDRANAKVFLERLLKAGGDGYDARILLGQIAAAQNDIPEAEKHYALAKKMDPHKAEPYLDLYKLYSKTREDDALKELEAAAVIDVMDKSIVKTLVEKYAAKANWPKVLTWAPKWIDIELYEAAAHKAYGRALLELGKKKEAQIELDVAKQLGKSEREDDSL